MLLTSDPLSDDLLPESERLEAVPFSTICALLRKGSLLEQYPAKPQKVELRAKGSHTASANSTSLSAAAPAFHPMFGSCNTTAEVNTTIVPYATSSATSALPQSCATTPAAPTPTWNHLLTIAATSLPNSLAEDPFAAMAGLA